MPAAARAGLDAEPRRCAVIAQEMIECDQRGEEFHRTLHMGLQNPLVDDRIDLFGRLLGELGGEVGPHMPEPAPKRGEVHQRKGERFDDLRRRVGALEAH